MPSSLAPGGIAAMLPSRPSRLPCPVLPVRWPMLPGHSLLLGHLQPPASHAFPRARPSACRHPALHACPALQATA